MSVNGFLRGGGNHLLAGLAAAIALPALAFLVGLPFLVALAIAAVLYAGLAILLAPRRVIERINASTSGRAQAELVAGLVGEAEAAVDRLRQAGRRIRSKSSARIVSHCAEVAREILDGLAAEPEKLSAVRRFVTYYLPRSAELAEGLALLETQRQPDPARIALAESTLTKLDSAFRHYADSLAEAELDQLDVELKLLERSLAEDIAPSMAEAPKPARAERA